MTSTPIRILERKKVYTEAVWRNKHHRYVARLADGRNKEFATEAEAWAWLKRPHKPIPALLRLRRRARMTQAEAARSLGVAIKTYQRWETGQSQPRPGDIERAERRWKHVKKS